jgi:hypothetical protein
MFRLVLLTVGLATAQIPEGNSGTEPDAPRAALRMFVPAMQTEAESATVSPMAAAALPNAATFASLAAAYLGTPEEAAAPADTPGIYTPITVSVPGTGLTAPKPAEVKPAERAEKNKNRGMPDPWPTAPWPNSQYQGYPVIGVPPDFDMWPLMQWMQGTGFNTWLVDNKIRIYGWVTIEYNWSNDKNSNTPDAYWVRPNHLDMDQALLRIDRNLDSVQTDHIDWGFRSTSIYGIDYRYTIAGGWGSEQLFNHNLLYGFDPTEQYLDVYYPWFAQGLILRVGRWIACPDIETQWAPDNYLGSHSILFAVDTYTNTGLMATIKLSDQWTFQAVIASGTDMAPWYKGAIPTGGFGLRWTAKSNRDAVYSWLNQINEANFRHFDINGTPAGHDNFNYFVSTWQHVFNARIMTNTESYYMWQNNAFVGGTPSIGPPKPYGSGGGLGAPIPGTARSYGVLNYTLVQISKYDFIAIRNEWYRDEQGERTGFPTSYTDNTIGVTHNFNRYFQMRPEIGYFRSWNVPAFDLGTKKNMVQAGIDMTLHF